jgi:hypothetical protein
MVSKSNSFYSKKRSTNSFNSLNYYKFLSRSKLFVDIEWSWLFQLQNFNLKNSKSFLPFIRIFRLLDRENLNFIWVYAPIEDELLIGLERNFNILNPDIIEKFSQVYKAHIFTEEKNAALTLLYEQFDPIFNQTKIGYNIRWCISRNLNQIIKKSYRIPVQRPFYNYFY